MKFGSDRDRGTWLTWWLSAFHKRSDGERKISQRGVVIPLKGCCLIGPVRERREYGVAGRALCRRWNFFEGGKPSENGRERARDVDRNSDKRRDGFGRLCILEEGEEGDGGGAPQHQTETSDAQKDKKDSRTSGAGGEPGRFHVDVELLLLRQWWCFHVFFGEGTLGVWLNFHFGPQGKSCSRALKAQGHCSFAIQRACCLV